jgi:hypothetical protein
VPYELVEKMDRTERLAWLIIIGELEGGKFDFGNWSWRDK